MTDYIIVGGGSAGCVLANRLSANPAVDVTLIEAGGWDRSPFIGMPAGYFQLMKTGQIDWGYHTEPQEHLAGRRLFWPRAKVLGGCSCVNGMIYIRGSATDYDRGRRWEIAVGPSGIACPIFFAPRTGTDRAVRSMGTMDRCIRAATVFITLVEGVRRGWRTGRIPVPG